MNVLKCLLPVAECIRSEISFAGISKEIVHGIFLAIVIAFVNHYGLACGLIPFVFFRKPFFFDSNHVFCISELALAVNGLYMLSRTNHPHRSLPCKFTCAYVLHTYIVYRLLLISSSSLSVVGMLVACCFLSLPS